MYIFLKSLVSRYRRRIKTNWQSHNTVFGSLVSVGAARSSEVRESSEWSSSISMFSSAGGRRGERGGGQGWWRQLKASSKGRWRALLRGRSDGSAVSRGGGGVAAVGGDWVYVGRFGREVAAAVAVVVVVVVVWGSRRRRQV